MEFIGVVNNRYSCKKFDTSKKVESDKLLAVREAGRLAPTAKNRPEHHI